MGLPAQVRRLPRERRAAEAPAPTFTEALGASFRASRDDQPGHSEEEFATAYGPIVEALTELNGRSITDYVAASRNNYQINESAIWRDIEAARRRDPAAFAGIEQNAETFRARVMRDLQARQARDADTATRSGWVPWLIGMAAGEATNPVNYVPGGKSATVARTAVRQMLVNGAIETALTPGIAAEREATGREFGIEEAAMNIGGAAAFGGVLGAAGKGIELHGGKVLDAAGNAGAAAREAVLSSIYSRLPESARARIAKRMEGIDGEVPDDVLPDLAEAAIGADRMTPDERAASIIMRRETEIDATNPFIPDGAGVAMHRQSIATAMQNILARAPASLAKPDLVLPTGSPVPRLSGSTSISSTIVGVEGATAFKAQVRQVESGGDLKARPRFADGRLRSSALGPYQFLERTWTKLYKRRFGDGGLSDAQIAAKRTDPRLNEVLIDDLISENTKTLHRGGFAADAGNLYLAHFAGPQGAIKLLSADPNASARSVLGDAVIRANGFLADMNAAQVIAWAHRKMGNSKVGATPTAPGPGVTSWRDRLNDEWATLEAERAATEAAGRIEPQFGQVSDIVEASIGEDVVPFEDLGDAIASPPIAFRADAPAAEIQALMPALRMIVADRSRSINKLDEIGAELNATPDEVRIVLSQLVEQGVLRMNRKTKKFMRPPVEGPMDVLKFLARRGGIHPTGLRGGIKDDGVLGHGLGKSTVVGGVRLGGRDMDRFVPGAGQLLRETGMGIDEASELLWDAGYFGPPSVTDRPSEAQVLEMLEQAVQADRRFYPVGEAPEAAPGGFAVDAQGWQEGEFEWLTRGVDEAAEELGVQLDDDAMQAIARLRVGNDMDAAEAIIEAINREADAARWDALAESDRAVYEEAYELANRPVEGERADRANRGEGREPDAGDAGAQRAGGDDGPAGTGQAAARLNDFDDPHGKGADAQIESMMHDVRAMLDSGEAADPALAERQRQEAQLRAASPMRAATDQDSTIGAPLFDAADQFGFRLSEEGEVVTAADLIAKFDEEDAAIATIRECLK